MSERIVLSFWEDGVEVRHLVTLAQAELIIRDLVHELGLSSPSEENLRPAILRAVLLD